MKTEKKFKERPKWKKPVIETKEIFEKTALACDGLNTGSGTTYPKVDGTGCGYCSS